MPKTRRLPMKRLSFVLLVFVLALAVVPSTALAKGPIEASIDGPGLGAPLQIGDRDNWGEEGAMASSQPIMQFAEAAGFFPAAFGAYTGPDSMLARRPAGNLGPRYVIEYRVPGPNGTEDLIVQDLYPYAKPAAVTYMEPGQTLFGTQSTRGGWFAGNSYTTTRPLLAVLVEAGLPRTPPGPDDGSSFPWTIAGALAALGAAVAAGALLAARRRPRASGARASA
jgi:hypothetical protein